MKIVISSGHGKYVRGAAGYIDEVDEARRVVEQVAEALRDAGIEAITFHDDVSQTQSENLGRIVDFHNSKTRDLDVSVHFNAYETTSKPMGTEVLYASSAGLEIAEVVVDDLSDAGHFLNRGPKHRTDLAFLNGTEEPAILIETCFVDSKADVDLYHEHFVDICDAIAEGISGKEPPGLPEVPTDEALLHVTGKCSYFGGPEDTGVSSSEGLAFYDDVDQAEHLFLPNQPLGTTGLARRLNPYVHYIACRWDYDVTSREMLRKEMALVRSKRTGYAMAAFPADWGPNENTGRVADLSPGLLRDLGLETDEEVEVIFPWRE